MKELPKKFLENMKDILKDEEEYTSFLESYEKQPKKGIRTNTLKISKDELLKRIPDEFQASDIPWSPTGLYIDNDTRPGKKPEYYTGLYYPQEPSAMSSAEALNVEEGDLILDLCAAPGGKSTQLAAKLGENGTLVLNEIMKGRVNTLASNVERMGVGNAIILNESPDRLVKNFYQAFDKILVDAPCSGEGMFRKDEDVIDEWSEDRPVLSSRKQKKILETVDELLRPGGELVYSTCTFSPLENEQVIEEFVKKGDYELLPTGLEGIETTGIKEVTESKLEDIELTTRIWPNHNEGEGHFVARLKKKEPEGFYKRYRNRDGQPLLKRAKKKDMQDYLDFQAEYLRNFDDEKLYIFRDKLYRLPEGINPTDLIGLKVHTPGLLLGELKKNRFEPSHTLAMNLKKENFTNTYELTEEQLWSYLKGEELRSIPDLKSGWILLLYEGYPVGFGKYSNNTIKNKYPKGLRIYKK